MEDIFAQASLCYLTNRCDEGFELIYSYLISLNNDLNLHCEEEEEEVFCLISMNILQKRYQSWLHLDGLLIDTGDLKQRQSIEIYLETIFNELNFYSKRILLLIEKFQSSASFQTKLFYLKLQGDIHFLLSQISKSNKRLEHIQSSLNFYNQSLEMCSHHSFNKVFISIMYNKALVECIVFLFENKNKKDRNSFLKIFILMTEEYDRAKNILHEALHYFDTKQISNGNELEKFKSLLKYLNEL